MFPLCLILFCEISRDKFKKSGNIDLKHTSNQFQDPD